MEQTFYSQYVPRKIIDSTGSVKKCLVRTNYDLIRSSASCTKMGNSILPEISKCP